MKNFIPILFLLFISCKSNYMVSQQINQKALTCPEKGICTIELIPNKSIEFKEDNIGILYPVISEGEKTLLKYTYKRNPIKNVEDSSYTEVIYAEFEKEFTELEISNNSLKDVKLYFGRLCYCKGQTGYYPIKTGKLKITKTGKNTINLDLQFKINEVPQIISVINETISLKSN